MESQYKLNEVISKYVGSTFEHGVMDCYQFLRLWYKEFGFDVPNYQYTEKWYEENNNYFVEEYHKLWEQVNLNEIKPHDAILFKVRSSVPNHVGIYIGLGKFIHCAENAGVVVTRLDKWKILFHSLYRLKA